MSTKPKIVLTEFGPVTESARQQAVVNMKLDPATRQAVLDLLIKKMGDPEKAEAEMRARYPELYEEDPDASDKELHGENNSKGQ